MSTWLKISVEPLTLLVPLVSAFHQPANTYNIYIPRVPCLHFKRAASTTSNKRHPIIYLIQFRNVNSASLQIPIDTTKCTVMFTC
ncbi:uncharacterized protein LAJ45_05185 [Morchella importuna]|uniref:uncharacterized protein n=1 Tax=Morchella importuna TaxID=1174673 RepID=UPI001E8E3A94|nr:uncharacterized protein LAJ45_05185 [Morchella importuna]KAH8150490.1 hypothetical protein LAJ45_05185 [Morchella importuna]